MKRDFLIVFSMFLTLTVGYFMNTPSIELDTHNVRTVTVKAGDTVWGIASQYANDHIDIREMVHTVSTLNKLDETASLEPGRTLKIPTVKTQNDKVFSEYVAQNE